MGLFLFAMQVILLFLDILLMNIYFGMLLLIIKRRLFLYYLK